MYSKFADGVGPSPMNSVSQQSAHRIIEPLHQFTGVPLDILASSTRTLSFREAKRDATYLLQQQKARRQCGVLCPGNVPEAGSRDTNCLNQGTHNEQARSASTSMPCIPGLQVESRDLACGQETMQTGVDTDDIEEEAFACEVCQFAYEDEDQVMMLPCSHYFHTPCISRWLEIKTTCPKCRYEISPPVPETREVIIRRTTTIEWMPVLQW